MKTPRSHTLSCLVLAFFLTGAACGDQAGSPLPAAQRAPARVPGVSLAAERGGLVLEAVSIVRTAPDIVEFRAELVNRGAAPADFSSVLTRLRDGAGSSALVLETPDGAKRLYPLVAVAGASGNAVAVASLAQGERRALAIRYGPISAEVDRLIPVVPGFASAGAIQIAENQ
jgi:hypothetical protein